MPNYLTELSPDNNSHVYQIKDKEATPIDLLKDTVGWVGKNLLEIPASVVTQTINGVTFTVNRNSDGEVTSVVANGTATAVIVFVMSTYTYAQGEYILSGCPSGGNSGTTYAQQIRDLNNATIINDEGNGKKGTLSNASYMSVIRIGNGYTANNLVFYPMLRDASIIDSTFEPYHESVEQCKFDRAEQRVLGAKNLLEPPHNASTVKGITYTPIEKGKVRVTGTLSEAATSQYKYKTLYASEGILEAGKTYILNKGVTEYAYIIIWFWDVNGTYITGVSSRNENGDIVFTVPSNTYRINYVLEVSSLDYGKTVNDVLELMLRLESDPDDTYAPHAMTNRELTDAVKAADAKIYCNWLPNGESVTVGERIYNGGVVFVWKGTDNGQYCFDRTSTVSAIKAMTGITVVSNGYNNVVTNVTISNSKGEGVFVAVISG